MTDVTDERALGGLRARVGRRGLGSDASRADDLAAPLEALFRDHAGHVFRYLRSRGLTESEAADLTADTFERAMRRHRGFRPRGGGERAWLITIARNAAVDHGRSQSRLRRWQTGMDAEPMSVPSAEDQAMREDEAADVRRRVDGLHEDQREAVRLRYAGGLTAREIGLVLGKSEAATQKLISRALQELRNGYDHDR